MNNFDYLNNPLFLRFYILKLNALVTVVNALKASKQMKAFGEFFNNQIEYATTVILSRSQNATPEQLEFCVKQIQKQQLLQPTGLPFQVSRF